MTFEIGDEVILKNPLWHEAQNVGDMMGIVISVKGHILVQIYNFKGSPVKCFRDELEIIVKKQKEYIELELEDDSWPP